MKTVVIGSDHAGFVLKQVLKGTLSANHRVVDVGTNSEEPVDYPDFSLKVGQAVLRGQAWRGILICGSGVGASVAANKIKGVRAGLCHDTYSAHQGVEHDNINVLVIGSRVVGTALAHDLVLAFLGAKFTREKRHVRRLAKVAALEEAFGANPTTQSH